MPRVYSNYTQQDFDLVNSLANEYGFSMSAFQRYCVMLIVDKRGNTSTITNLSNTMFNNLNKVKSNDSFIVSSLLPDEWPSLSRNDKQSLAKQLAHYVKNNVNLYGIKSKYTSGKATVYYKK